MDFQFTASQMVNLVVAPQEVYVYSLMHASAPTTPATSLTPYVRCVTAFSVKSTTLRKQIKNQWARDDPAFIVLLVYLIAAGSAAYSVTFGVRSVWHFVRIVCGSVFLEFGVCGVIIATAYRYAANTYLRWHRVMTNTEQSVEWLYAFDIHCNAFFCLFLLLWPVQFLMCPILLGESFLCTLLSNTVYALAFVVYHYITFIGYNALPFLQKTERFLFPIGGVAVCYLLTLLFRINLSRLVLGLYFD